MRYPHKLEALIRGEVVKSYNIGRPNHRGSVDSEDMESSEEEIEQEQHVVRNGVNTKQMNGHCSSTANNIMFGKFQSAPNFETILNTDLDGEMVGPALKKRHPVTHLNLGINLKYFLNL